MRQSHSHNLVYEEWSSEGGPSEASERCCSTQRSGSHTEDGATSSGSSPLSGAPPWLPIGLHRAPQAAHPCYNCSMASQRALHILPLPSPPPSLALEPPVSSSGIEWRCAAKCEAPCTTCPAHRIRTRAVSGARTGKTRTFSTILVGIATILHCLIAIWPRIDLPGRTVTKSEPVYVSFSPVRIAGKTQQQHLLGNHLGPLVERPNADPAERQLISAFNTLQ